MQAGIFFSSVEETDPALSSLTFLVTLVICEYKDLWAPKYLAIHYGQSYAIEILWNSCQ